MSQLVPVFVYGTLRTGDYNSGRFGGVEKVVLNCTTNGNLYHAYPRARVYPGARFDEDGTIIGELHYYEPGSQALQSIVSMEKGAGYSLVEIEVDTPDGPVEAYAFQYELDHGPLIPTGDWFNDPVVFDRYETFR